ncbi:UNVERIFIED_CONTAM: hypothetical protein Sradi_6948700 [Sesamum radiatum]|uniref:Uncharacterized protein n=1 Tax=Sesamum radiatum TaxID=300843 RepID=A0AAW2JGA5_SESRA
MSGMSAEVSGGTPEESPLAAIGTPSSLVVCPPSLGTFPSTDSVAAAGGTAHFNLHFAKEAI